MEIHEFLKPYSDYRVAQGWSPNQYKTKPKIYNINAVEVEEFNKILRYLRTTDMRTIIRTKSGGIKKGGIEGLYNCRAWDLVKTAIGARITVRLDGYTYVFKLGKIKIGEQDKGIYPNQAFSIFKQKCADNNIDLDSYKINNGKEVKETIEKPLINMKYHMSKTAMMMTNCHHIDFHSSYPAGLCNTHPEFKPVIEPIYNERKDPDKSDINKAILNFTIGWMQSYEPTKGRFAEWAHLSRDAIADNNKRILEMTKRLEANKDEIIGYNTDGIWYRGPIYHASDEGPNLGQWHNDHVNCLFRSKSNGAYEFIEDGVYTPVVRGCSTYDMIEPDRKKWKPGDIYKGETYGFRYDNSIGEFIYEEIKEI